MKNLNTFLLLGALVVGGVFAGVKTGKISDLAPGIEETSPVTVGQMNATNASLVAPSYYVASWTNLAGYGATDNHVPRFSFQATNNGAGVAWDIVTNAANGMRMTALKSGWLTISFTHCIVETNQMAIFRNPIAAELNIRPIGVLSASNIFGSARLSVGAAAVGNSPLTFLSGNGHCNSGEVFVVTTEGAATAYAPYENITYEMRTP